MNLLFLALVGPAALAGYGDVDQDGDPAWEERDLHLWTNAARVDPEAFEADYNSGGCSFDDFSSDEATPKAPLYYDTGLGEAAIYHTDDMHDSGNFSHSSSDGTSFATRVARYYTDSGYVGENIAWGYASGYSAVMTGWMCSTEGHRANIMGGDYNELGTGVVDNYYTQDFGAGTVSTDSPVAMANHAPVSPSEEASFYADWQDAREPVALELVLDGIPSAMELTWGTAEQGIYGVALELDPEEACHSYFVRWTREDGTSGAFPEEGSYTFGSGCEGDLGWIPEQVCGYGCDGRGVDDLVSGVELIGCASAGAPAAWGAALAAIALLGARRGSASATKERGTS